jgi:hypothetical protein
VTEPVAPGQTGAPEGTAPPVPPQLPTGGEPPAGFPAMEPTPVKKRGKARLYVAIGAVVVVVVIAIIGYVANRSDPDNAKVGSCMAGQRKEDMKVVDCTKAHDWTVVGKVGGKTYNEVNDDMDGTICKDAAGTEAEFWKGKQGERGYVLCLAPAK